MSAQKLFILALCLLVSLDCAGQMKDKPSYVTYKVIGAPGLSEAQIRSRLECGKLAMEKWLFLNNDDKIDALLAVYIEDYTKLSFAKSPEEKLIDSVRVDGNFYPKLKAWPSWWPKMQWVLRREAMKEAAIAIERLKNIIRRPHPPQPLPTLTNSAILMGVIFSDTNFVVRWDDASSLSAFDSGMRQLLNYTTRGAISIITTANAETFAKTLSKTLRDEPNGVFVID